MANRWTTGGCLAFARALREAIGGRLWDVVEPDPPDVRRTYPGTPHHIVVKKGEQFIDAEGTYTADELLRKWDALVPQWVNRPLRLEPHSAARAKDAGMRCDTRTAAEARVAVRWFNTARFGGLAALVREID